MEKVTKYSVSLLLMTENNIWTAQCLEFDIAAQGKTMSEAMAAFQRTFAGQVCIDIENGKEPFEDFSQAPVDYWDKFEQASERLADRKPFKLPEGFPANLGLFGVADQRIYAN